MINIQLQQHGFRLTAIASLVMTAFLSGCGGGHKASVDPIPELKSPRSLELEEDKPAKVNLVSQGAELDGIEIYISTPPAHGTIDGIAPNYTYVPDPDYNGEDSFTIKVTTANEEPFETTVKLHIFGVNDLPTGTSQTVELKEDSPVEFALNVSDADGDTLNISVTQQAAKGTVTLNGRSIIYVPNPDETGTDSFQYRASDKLGDSESIEVTLHIEAVNDAPVISGDRQVHIAPGQIAAIDLKVTDPDSDNVGFYITDAPIHGELSISDNTISYLANPYFTGIETISLMAEDGESNSTPFEIEVLVHPATLTSQTGELVILNGNNFTRNNDAISFFWEQLSGPKASLINASSNTALFSAPTTPGTARFAFKSKQQETIDTIYEIDVNIQGQGTPSVKHHPFRFNFGYESLSDILNIDDNAFVSVDNYGIVIIDTTELNYPKLAGGIFLGSGQWKLAGEGNTLLAGKYNKVHAIDITTPRQSIIADTITLDNFYPDKLALENNRLTLFDNFTGIRVFDVSNEHTLVAVQSTDFFPGSAVVDAIRTQEYQYLLDNNLLRIQTSNDNSTVALSSLDDAVRIYGIEKSQDNIVATTESGISIYSLSDPLKPVLIGKQRIELQVEGDLRIHNDKVYVNSIYNGIAVIDISNPTQPAWTQTINTAGRIQQFNISNNGLLLIDQLNGLQHIRLAQNQNTSHLSMRELTEHTYDVKRMGDYLYAGSEGDLRTLDVTNVKSLIETSSNIYARNNYRLYQIDHQLLSNNNWLGSTLYSLDATGQPQPAIQFDSKGARATAFNEKYLFIADQSQGLVVFDKTTGEIISSTPIEGYARGIAISGNAAFIAAGSDDIFIYNIEDPTAPGMTGKLAIDGWAEDLIVENNILYVNASLGGIQTYDISDLSSIQALSTFTHEATSNSSRHFSKLDNTLYVANFTAGLNLLDVSDPQHIRLKGHYDLPDRTYNVDADDKYIYTANYYSGVYLLDNIRPALNQNYNTAPPASTLDYEVSWYSVNDLAVDCQTNGGTCAVENIDTATQTATIHWTLPARPGNYSLNALVGNTQFFQAASDSVLVE